MSILSKLKDFLFRDDKVKIGGGEKANLKQTAMGKMTARERIHVLLDPDTFFEFDLFVKHEGKDF